MARDKSNRKPKHILEPAKGEKRADTLEEETVETIEANPDDMGGEEEL